MKKQKRCMALAAALTMSLAISSTALAAVPSDIGGHWAQGTIIQWTSKGYISGYEDGTFKPDNSITRAEFVRLVNQSMGYTKTGNAYFSDVSSSYWGYNDIQKGVAAGYVRGDGNGKFRPNDPVSRQEAAVMISQICGLGQDYSAAAKYTDYRYIPSWAAGYVGAVSKAGIMSGYPDGDFKGDRYLSRAEAVIALDKALNYNASTTDNREVLKNYKLTDTSLKDKIIQGDLTISSSLSKKDVVLDNVKVEGSIIVEGGKTITAKNCEINNLEMSTSDATFDATGKTTVKKTTFEKYGKLTGSGYSKVVIDEDLNDYVTLDAQIEEVELDEETNVKLLSDCVIDSFTATKNADNATINFNSAKVKNMYLYDAVRITGKGDIRNMTVYESGVKSSIKPDDLTTKNGASKPTYTENSSGDITWGGSSRYDDLTASKDGKTYRGGKYDDVKVTGDDITLDDMTIYGNLYISKDLKEGDVSLEDLTIKGNVYIEGGGKNSVDFDYCEIDGNIYVKKLYKDYPVAVEFDKYTASHIDGKVVISENGAIIKESESGALIDNIEVKTSREVVIGTDVKNLDVMTKTSNLTINSGSDITKLTVSTNAKDSKITINGKVKELYTNVDITVNVSGTVEKTSGSGTVNGISVTGVKLNKTELSLEKGKTETLTATIEPPTATNKSLSWSSNKESVATVDSNGKVTAVAPGEATITVKADGGKTETCKVTVTSNAAEEVNVTIDGDDTVKMGSTIKLTANVTPVGTNVESTEWKSENPRIATVNQGTVTPVAVGTTTIKATITTEDGKTYTAEHKITVEPKETVTDTIIIEGSKTVSAGGTITLQAKLQSNETVVDATWSSSSPTVATVTKGKVEGLTEGKTTITATSTKDGVTAIGTVEIEVIDDRVHVTGVILDKKELKLEKGQTETLTATVNPGDATDKSVTWSSSNTAVATVDQSGKVTAVANGEATITVTTKDGGKTATCKVTVINAVVPVTDLSVRETLELTVGQTETLEATITPSNATNTNVTWESLNPDVATVDNNGKVVAESAGDATITVTTADGNHTATCTVTVKGADKTALDAAIAEASTINPTKAADGTTVSMNSRWAAGLSGFNNALDAAKKVSADKGATNSEVTQALNALNAETGKLNYGIKELVDLVNGYRNTQAGVQPAVTNVHVVNSEEEAASLSEGEKWILKTNEQALTSAITAADASINSLKSDCKDKNAVTNAMNTFTTAVNKVVVVKHGATPLL